LNFLISWPETGVAPHIFIVRRLGKILCNHLRWGHPPSAGPRQKEGAGLASWQVG
jgi:hypothetical protein